MIDWILMREGAVPPLGLLQIYRVYLPPGERGDVPDGLPDGLYLVARMHGLPPTLNAFFGPMTEEEADEEVKTNSPTDWVQRFIGELEKAESMDGDIPNDGTRH